MGRSNVTRAASRTACLLLAAAASLATATAQASGKGAQAGEPPPPELQRTRGKRWWIDFWCHSMQEQAFVEWMHQSTGSTAWMHVMTVQQVNALYGWWLVEVWFGSGGEPPR